MLAGVTAVILVGDQTTLVAATPPTVTLVGLVRFVPIIVMGVPPAVDPNNGDTEVIVGTGAIYVNAFGTVAVPAGVVTATLLEPKVPAGVTAVIFIDETTTKFVTFTPPTVTLVAPVRLVPTIVIAVPPAVGPDIGVIDVIVGSRVLATRNPKLKLMMSGVYERRPEARQFPESPFQGPPRNKRLEPDVGPVGLVTLTDE